MPCNPWAIEESDRSHQYRMMWLGAGGALFTTANLFVGMDNFLSAMAFGAMAGGPMSVAFGSRNDEYLRSLMDVGLRWMSAVLSAYLLGLFFMRTIDAAHGLSFAFGSGTMLEPSDTPQWLIANGLAAAIVLTLAFYAGFAFQYCRDHFTAVADA
ncbi:MAG: hypothetical protein ACXIUO_05700 [Erythrobacter sp.]